MKLTVQTFLTLDGVMQAPGGPEEDSSEAFTHGGWQAPFPDPAVGGGAGSTGRRSAGDPAAATLADRESALPPSRGRGTLAASGAPANHIARAS